MGAKASPDGYTLTMGSSGPFTIVPLFQKTPYDAEKDFTPVAMVGLSPYNLVTTADFPAKNAAEFVALLKANPGKYTFASSGSGATAHLIAESFNAASGIKAVHVPYKGSVPALTDVAGGQVTYSIETAASTMPFIRNGRLKGYGVSLKDGSTVTPGQEPLAKVANIPGFDLGAWVGVLVPAGTPQPVIDRLSAAIAKIMKLPEVQKQFDTIAVQVDYRNQENFKKYLKSISQEFATVIKTNDIKVE
jgi:tripartite-type tricarboxylate transporter receptor subunit TctC